MGQQESSNNFNNQPSGQASGRQSRRMDDFINEVSAQRSGGGRGRHNSLQKDRHHQSKLTKSKTMQFGDGDGDNATPGGG